MESYYEKVDKSLKSFLKQIKGRNTRSNKTDVYRAIKKKGSTNRDLIKSTKLPHQTVTSRISALMDLGIVEVIGKQTSFSSAKGESIYVIQENPEKIKENQVARAELKIARLKKQLSKFE
jgi:hypothetical protein